MMSRTRRANGEGPSSDIPFGNSDIEILCFRVVQDKSVRGLLGMQLQLLGQFDADSFGFEQRNQLGSILEIRARAVSERIASAAVLEIEVTGNLGGILLRDGVTLGKH